MSFEAFWATLHERRRPGDPCLMVLAVTPSSHQTARALIAEYSHEGDESPSVDVIAWQQTGGHGRGGRRWSSPAGAGAYLSMVRSIAHMEPQLLPLLVAVTAADVLTAHVETCALKWPNDLMVGKRKLGGLLIDVLGSMAILSVGVNVAADLELFDIADATSLGHESSTAPSSAQVASELARGLAVAIESPPARAQVLARYQELSCHRPGDVLRWHQDGDTGGWVEGIFQGFDDRGFLRLEVDGEERSISAGRVSAP